MIYHKSSSSELTFRALANALIVFGIADCRPVSIRLRVDGDILANLANSLCDKAFLFLRVFNLKAITI